MLVTVFNLAYSKPQPNARSLQGKVVLMYVMKVQPGQRSVVSPRCFSHVENSLVPIQWKLGEPHSQSGYYTKEINLLPSPGTVQPIAQSPYRLHYPVLLKCVIQTKHGTRLLSLKRGRYTNMMLNEMERLAISTSHQWPDSLSLTVKPLEGNSHMQLTTRYCGETSLFTENNIK